MERYIIPFDYDGKSFYVFIDKDAAHQVYRVGKILPSADGPYSAEISFESLTQLNTTEVAPLSFDATILNTLFKFLEARGWIALAN